MVGPTHFPTTQPLGPGLQIYEVGHDRLGSFTGFKKVMDLKGHKSKVLALDFSPDLGKMVTASADGERCCCCTAGWAGWEARAGVAWVLSARKGAGTSLEGCKLQGCCALGTWGPWSRMRGTARLSPCRRLAGKPAAPAAQTANSINSQSFSGAPPHAPPPFLPRIPAPLHTPNTPHASHTPTPATARYCTQVP